MKKNIIILIAAMFAAFTLSAQTPTYFGIGIANPVGNLHVHSLEEPPLPPAPEPDRDGPFFQNNYQGYFHMTNGNTGTSIGDGFTIAQYNYNLIFSQHENGFVRWDLPQDGKVWLLPGGRVGIGDTTAGYRLSVGGAARVCGNLSVCDTLRVGSAFRVLPNGALQIGNTAVWALPTGDLWASHQVNVGNEVRLYATGDITASGSATIGSGFYCDNLGNLKVKQLRVTLTDWPDYVFGDDYRLMPLGEVEAYIGENGHLPQMPSAAEVEADGADLGEMNRLLLQKVEELTLYIIDLQKQVDELKSNK